jgi:hypothetical protein
VAACREIEAEYLLCGEETSGRFRISE